LEPEGTEQKIIMTTIQLLGTEGTRKLTIRRVAERCGVNIAAINYYFRSKENLINRALKHYAELTQKVFLVLGDETLPPYERLHTFMIRFSMHLITYPGFMKSLLMQTMNDDSMPTQAQESMQRGRTALLRLIASALPQAAENREALKYKIFQMMGGLLYPLIWGQYTQTLYDIDFTNAAVRLQYIDTLLQSFFPELCPTQEAAPQMNEMDLMDRNRH
jgi:AcrR family transcriptional regulator